MPTVTEFESDFSDIRIAFRADRLLSKIFKGALPFVANDILHTALLILLPVLVLWLPNL